MPVKPRPKVVKYDRTMKIINVDALPRGLGAKYMLAFDNGGKEYIAAKWLRKLPTTAPQRGFVVIQFTGK